MERLSDSFDIEAIWAEREELAGKTLQTVSAVEARALIEEVFQDQTSHPWYENAQDFMTDHERETAVRGHVPDGVKFLYYPKAGRGMWFKMGARLEAVGLIGPRGLKVLGKLVAAKNLNP